MKKDIYWYVGLTFVMVVWATVYPVTKMVVRKVDPLTISLLRYLIGIIPLFPFFLVELNKRRMGKSETENFLSFKDVLSMSFLGLLGVTFFALFLFYGIKFSTASNGSLLANTQPIFTTLLAPLVIKEQFSFSRILGAFIGVIGIALVVTGGNLREIFVFSGLPIVGNILLVLSAISMSIFSIFLKRYIKRYGGIIPTFITMLSGSFFLALVILGYVGGFRGLAGIGIWDWLALVYVGVVGTALVYLIFNRALEAIGVVRAVGFKLMIPVLGAFFSIILLGEKPGWAYVVGAILVLGAIYFIQKPINLVFVSGDRE